MNVSSKVLIINGSNRLNSNTHKLIEKLFEDYKLVNLMELDIAHYNYDGEYGHQDDFQIVADMMIQADFIVLATPVYWYSMSGYLKIFIDRWTDLVTNQKIKGRQLKGKSIALVAQSSSDSLPDGFVVPIASTSAYMDMNFLGYVFWDSRSDIKNTVAQKTEVSKWLAAINN